MKSPFRGLTGTFSAPPAEAGEHAERHGRQRGAVTGRGDPIGRLPIAAKRRLLRLRGMAEDIRNSTLALTDKRFEFYEIRRDAQQRLKELQRDFAPATAIDAIAEAAGRVEAADAAIAEIDERIERLRRQSPSCLARVEGWLKSLPVSGDAAATIGYGATMAYVEPADHVEIAYRKGESPQAALERLRQEIQSAKVELATARAAPLPSSEVKENVRREIEALAERGRPNFLPAIDLGAPVKWPQVAHQNFGGKADTSRPTIGAVSGGGGGPDYLGILAWAHRDAMIAAAEREIDELAENEYALSSEARETKEAELLAKIFGLELQE
jgi:hypothetical protein